jgi:hypothetical protein
VRPRRIRILDLIDLYPPSAFSVLDAVDVIAPIAVAADKAE